MTYSAGTLARSGEQDRLEGRDEYRWQFMCKESVVDFQNSELWPCVIIVTCTKFVHLFMSETTVLFHKFLGEF